MGSPPPPPPRPAACRKPQRAHPGPTVRESWGRTCGPQKKRDAPFFLTLTPFTPSLRPHPPVAPTRDPRPWADGGAGASFRPPPPPVAGPAPHIAPTPTGGDDDAPPAWPPLCRSMEARPPRASTSSMPTIWRRECGLVFCVEGSLSLDTHTPHPHSPHHHPIHSFRSSPTYAATSPSCAASTTRCGGCRCRARDRIAGVTALVAALDTLTRLIDAVPPAAAALRYGNPAFRTWHAQAVDRAPELLRSVLPEDRASDADVLAPYLTDALGNPSRVDYGTGHETAFVELLFCLAAAGAFEESDARALVTHAFSSYSRLTRRLQTTYWLEPAGSHGVWGLDDYVFLPFYWGAAQLEGAAAAGAGAPRPGGIRDDRALAEWGDEYMYLDAVRFVRQVRESARVCGWWGKGKRRHTQPTSPPPSHSPGQERPPRRDVPMLCDIAAVPTWAKVCVVWWCGEEESSRVFFLPHPHPPPPLRSTPACSKCTRSKSWARCPSCSTPCFVTCFRLGGEMFLFSASVFSVGFFTHSSISLLLHNQQVIVHPTLI